MPINLYMELYSVGTSGILLIILSFLSPSLAALQIFMVVLFLISSPAASSANLTASELFPTESRCLILSVIFVVGMLGGIVGVWVESLLAAGILMVVAGTVGWVWGVDAEGRTLE